MRLFFCFCVLSAQALFAAFAWELPATLSSPPAVVSDPKVVMTSGGDAVAVWIEDGALVACEKPLGGNWGSVVTIASSNVGAVGLVIDHLDKSTVIWEEAGDINVAPKGNGQNWGTTKNLNSGGGASPMIAVGSNRELVAVWVKSGNVETKSKNTTGPWNANPTILTSNNAANPKVSLGGPDSDNTVAVIWEEDVGNKTVLNSVNRPFSGTFGTIHQLSNGNKHAGYASMSVDSQGDILALWYEFVTNGGSSYRAIVLKTSVKTFGDPWDQPVALSEPFYGLSDQLQTRLVSDSKGNTFAVWIESESGWNVLSFEAIYKAKARKWSEPSKFVKPQPGNFWIELSLDQVGNVYDLHTEYVGNDVVLFGRLTTIQGPYSSVWTPVHQISTAQYNAFPSIAAVTRTSLSHEAAAIWVGEAGGNQAIYASTASGTIVLPPTGLNVVQNTVNFGLFSTYENVLTWTDSVTPGILQYVVLRDGLTVDIVKPGVQTSIDRNRELNQPVVYSIIALRGDFLQSEEATVQFP